MNVVGSSQQTNIQEMIENKGCTANVLLLANNTLCVANAGDSRCVFAVNGKAVVMSTDHKPTNLTEKNRILRAGSTVNAEGRIDGNLNLSRAIGDLKYKKNRNLKAHEHAITAFPEIKQKELSKQIDFIVMGCDGIWESKTNQ